jgi:hypothetical protein
MKVEWIAWVKHLASSRWHQVAHSEDFPVVYDELLRYVRQNKVVVKFHILMTGADPSNLPSDFPEPAELRG